MVAKIWNHDLGKGLDLTYFSKKNCFFKLVLTSDFHTSLCDNWYLVFSQGIIHDDTLKGSDWDA